MITTEGRRRATCRRIRPGKNVGGRAVLDPLPAGVGGGGRRDRPTQSHIPSRPRHPFEMLNSSDRSAPLFTLQLVSHWSHTAPRPLPWTAPAAIPNTGTPSTSKSSWGLRIGFVAKRGGVCGGGVLQVWYGSGVMPPAGTYAYWCVRRALSLLRFLVVRTRLGAKLWAAGFD